MREQSLFEKFEFQILEKNKLISEISRRISMHEELAGKAGLESKAGLEQTRQLRQWIKVLFQAQAELSRLQEKLEKHKPQEPHPTLKEITAPVPKQRSKRPNGQDSNYQSYRSAQRR